MAVLLLFNKPFNVLSQFSGSRHTRTLADYLDAPGYYPAGRLDKDSEGLLLLTDDGRLQARITDPRYKLAKTYWVQVEGEITGDALHRLSRGVTLKDGRSGPAKARRMAAPALPPRDPPIRYRRDIPTSWLSLTITEGRNRQVRRMTASVGFPTLRLYRYQVGSWTIEGLGVGEYRREVVHLPAR